MRRFLISILVASAAPTPALAAPSDAADRQQTREERQQAREAARVERESDRAEAKAERVESRQSVDATAGFRANAGAPQVDLDQVRAVRQADRVERVEQRQIRRDQNQADRQLRQSTRPIPRVLQNRVPVVSNEPREGTQPPLRTQVRRTSAPQWSTNWRHSDRYDWKKHRNRHRSLFHLGFYYDPFGWGYQPYQLGWRLWPSYYSNRYWLNDPWQYRLPYAPPGYRWIRYYDDAVLVDTWTGEVVDVIYSFFW